MTHVISYPDVITGGDEFVVEAQEISQTVQNELQALYLTLKPVSLRRHSVNSKLRQVNLAQCRMLRKSCQQARGRVPDFRAGALVEVYENDVNGRTMNCAAPNSYVTSVRPTTHVP